MDEIMKLVKAGAGFSAIKAACDAAGMNCLIRVYSGSSVPTWPEPEVPYVIDTYDTHNHGELTSFTVSPAQPDDVIEYKGMKLRVIVNEFVQGDAHMPSTMWFLAEKVEVQ